MEEKPKFELAEDRTEELMSLFRELGFKKSLTTLINFVGPHKDVEYLIQVQDYLHAALISYNNRYGDEDQ